MGSNHDYTNNYLQPDIYDTSRRYSPEALPNFSWISSLNNFKFIPSKPKRTKKIPSFPLYRLYKLGARKLVTFEIGPIGCIPSIARHNKHNGRCVEEINQLANVFNKQLATMLTNLTSTLEDSAFILGPGNWLGYHAIRSPSSYDSSNPCCITWANGTSGCIPGLARCPNTDKHYFWDGFHLCEAVYSVIAARCINGTGVCITMNMQEL
ncbi:hypothetical protein RJ640_029672, partial [Escallonia rubra]